VQLGEFAVWDAKACRRDVRYEWLNGREVHDGVDFDPLANLLAEHSAKERAPTRVDTDNLPSTIDLGNLDLIGNDEPSSNQVDEMTREQVLSEQQFTRSSLESAQIHPSPFKGHATLAEPTDLSNGDEEVATFDANHRAHDRRVRVVAESRDQILDATNPVTVRIEDWTAQEC
jgi:hypothetical protein